MLVCVPRGATLPACVNKQSCLLPAAPAHRDAIAWWRHLGPLCAAVSPCGCVCHLCHHAARGSPRHFTRLQCPRGVADYGYVRNKLVDAQCCCLEPSVVLVQRIVVQFLVHHAMVLVPSFYLPNTQRESA